LLTTRQKNNWFCRLYAVRLEYCTGFKRQKNGKLQKKTAANPQAFQLQASKIPGDLTVEFQGQLPPGKEIIRRKLKREQKKEGRA